VREPDEMGLLGGNFCFFLDSFDREPDLDRLRLFLPLLEASLFLSGFLYTGDGVRDPDGVELPL
jgi:hypothetical protein